MSDEVTEALAPVRAYLLREAEAEAKSILAEARAQADSIVQQAQREATETVGRARAQGEADSAPAAAAERSRARDQARSIVLAAQQEAYQELRGQVRAAVGGLRSEPSYQALLSRLVTMATRAAGPGAAVTVQPEGGVLARSRDVMVDCTLAPADRPGRGRAGKPGARTMDAVSAGPGRVARVNGPLVEITSLTGVAMYDIVELGERLLPGEAVEIRDDVITVQAYEYTGGLAPGDPARSRGEPLAARLGPHLLGGIFDRLLRPLAGAPAWLEPGYPFRLPDGQEWEFTPQAEVGTAVSEGVSLGSVAVSGGIGYRVLVPPGVHGTVDKMREAGPAPTDAVIATVSGTDVHLTSSWPVRRPRPYRQRLEAAAPLLTRQRVVDVLFPVIKGGSCAVPGGFGTGKTVLLQQITKWCDADVIVYVGCGERGNELADMLAELAGLSDPRTGGKLAARTVVIANTSNMPMMAREASIYSAASVAEHFRDMGLDVVVVADSTSRWAEALREFASRNGDLPAEEGYPASLSSALAAFYERAGRVVTSGGREGSVTIIGAVSPAGGDMTEPVTAYTQRFVRSLWSLDRDLAYARHYPAVSWSGSFSRDVDAVATWQASAGDPGWAGRRTRLAALLAEADRLSSLAELLGAAALPPRERATILAGRLIREGLLQQSALSSVDADCDSARAAALGDAILAVAERCQQLADSSVPLAALEELDFSPILRAREEAATPDAVAARKHVMLSRLDDLPRRSQDAGAE